MRISHTVRFVALSLFMLAGISTASAAEGIKVATVDVQQLISESKAGKSIQKQLVAEREAIQAEAAKLDQSLQTEQKSLIDQRAKLSQEDFSNKQIEFEKNLLEARSKLQNRGRALDKAANDSFNELRKQITEIVYEMATAQNIDLVLTRQNVVAAAKSIDVTTEVLKALDKKTPEMKLRGSEAKAAPAKPAGKS